MPKTIVSYPKMIAVRLGLTEYLKIQKLARQEGDTVAKLLRSWIQERLKHEDEHD